MKKSEKIILIAIAAFFIFYWFNMLVLYPLGLVMIPGGNEFENSYHAVSYSANAGIASIIITCTYIIVNKNNELLKELRKEN